MPAAEDHFNRGIAFHDQRRLNDAIEAFGQAIRLKPDYWEAYSELGVALKAAGRLDEAIDSHRKALELKPGLAEAHYNLGIALQAKGDQSQAASEYRQAIRMRPDFALAHNNLGNVLLAAGQPAEATQSYRSAIQIDPRNPDAHYNLGVVLQRQGQLDEAVAEYRRAIQLRPGWAEPHNNLGNALKAKGLMDEAIAAFRQAVRIKPDFSLAHGNLGQAFFDKGELDEAIQSFRTLVRLAPSDPQAHNNLGTSLKCRGEIREAIEAFRRAMALRPDAADAHSNLILMLHYHSDFGAGAIREEAVRWNERYGEPARKLIRAHENSCDPDRRLRIGYVSADFCDHVAGRMLLPLVRTHDRRNVSVYCYSNVARPDQITPEFVKVADHWRDVSRLADDPAAEQIRCDKIDILIDASLHTAGNRLPLMARKPAPVQATYLGYCGTSGLTAIDYRLSDPYFESPESDLNVYAERTIRLPRCYWFYEASPAAPDVSLPPSAAAGRITFGCMNNVAKVSPAAMDLWARILRDADGSRFVMHSPSSEHRRFVRSFFAGRGIRPERIEFIGSSPMPQYFESFSRIDIALDPFPYTGGVTTCDTLWMGVPVVTLSGETAVGRGGRSILSNVGLSQLIAYSPDQYVPIAIGLGADTVRLVELRRTMRDRMRASPLMDGPGFVADLENAYRQMWRAWCGTKSG